MPNDLEKSKISSEDEDTDGDEGIHRIGSLPDMNVINASLMDSS